MMYVYPKYAEIYYYDLVPLSQLCQTPPARRVRRCQKVSQETQKYTVNKSNGKAEKKWSKGKTQLFHPVLQSYLMKNRKLPTISLLLQLWSERQRIHGFLTPATLKELFREGLHPPVSKKRAQVIPTKSDKYTKNIKLY